MNGATGAGVQVEIGAWVSAGWRMFTSHWQTWVKMAALAFLPMLLPIGGLIAGYVGMITAVVASFTYDMYGNVVPVASLGPPLWVFLVFGVSGLLFIVAIAVSMYVSVGMWKAALKQARGGIPEMSDLRGNGALFFRVLGAAFVVGIMASIGFMLCYIPGLIVIGWYQFVLPLVIDRNRTLGEALTESKNASSPQLLMFILWAFVVSLLSSLGVYACYIGIIATLPLQFTMGAVAYRAVFEGVNWVQPPAQVPAAYPR